MRFFIINNVLLINHRKRIFILIKATAQLSTHTRYKSRRVFFTYYFANEKYLISLKPDKITDSNTIVIIS